MKRWPQVLVPLFLNAVGVLCLVGAWVAANKIDLVVCLAAGVTFLLCAVVELKWRDR